MYNYLIGIRGEFDRSRMIGFFGSTLLYQLSKVEFVALVRLRSGRLRRIARQKIVVLDRTTEDQHVVVERLLCWKAFVDVASGSLRDAFEAVVLVVQRVRTDRGQGRATAGGIAAAGRRRVGLR